MPLEDMVSTEHEGRGKGWEDCVKALTYNQQAADLPTKSVQCCGFKDQRDSPLTVYWVGVGGVTEKSEMGSKG